MVKRIPVFKEPEVSSQNPTILHYPYLVKKPVPLKLISLMFCRQQFFDSFLQTVPDVKVIWMSSILVSEGRQAVITGNYWVNLLLSY